MISMGSRIHQTAIIYPDVEIEKDVVIGPFCVIGGPPEHREYYNGEDTQGLIIRSGARIFSHVTIDAGTVNSTIIGHGSVVFNHSHIGHDTILQDFVTVGGNVSIAGHCYLMDGANVGGKSCLVQRCVIGAYGFLGGFTYLTKHAEPGSRYLGIPAKFVGHNVVGLNRADLSYEDCLLRYEDEFIALTKDRPI